MFLSCYWSDILFLFLVLLAWLLYFVGQVSPYLRNIDAGIGIVVFGTRLPFCNPISKWGLVLIYDNCYSYGGN